jgi:hypothetical protein
MHFLEYLIGLVDLSCAFLCAFQEARAHLLVEPGASRSSHRGKRVRRSAARGARGGGRCSYCRSNDLMKGVSAA